MKTAMARRRLAWLLAGALLLAQALGLAHRVLHAPGAALAASVAQAAAPGLFTDHAADSPECRLFDALAHADAASSAGAPTPAGAPPAWSAPANAPERTRAGCAAYLARAPPSA